MGSLDTAPLDLRAILRPSSPNDAFACAPGTCAAQADFASPVYPIDRTALLQAAEAILLAEPRTAVASRDDALPQVVLVQRSRLFGFADTIRVQAAGEDGAASPIVHSRSNTGYYDFGVNRKRVRRLLDGLAHRLSGAAPSP